MNNTAVLYTRQRTTGELQLRLFDAPSTMSRTIGTVPDDVVDLTEESQPDSHSLFILTMRDDSNGMPSLAIVSDTKGVLYREVMAAPGTLANGVLQVRHYATEEIDKTGGDLTKARPSSVDPLALSTVLRQALTP